MSTSTAARAQRRITARALGLGTSALLAAALMMAAPSVTSGWNQGAAEATLWQLLNGARVNNGMAPLQQHSTLVSLARWRSSDMLQRDYFSHTIPGCGCLVYAYYDRHGLNYVWGGENIGWNSGRSDAESPVRVHEQFMASPGHRANVLNRAFTHGGVGAAAADNKMFQGYVQNTRMYTELFLQAPAPAPAPAPAQPAPAPAQPAPAPAQAAPAPAPAQAAPAPPAPAPQPAAPAPAPAPAPPPSGGSGGAGGAGAAAPVQPAAVAVPTAKPTAKPTPKPKPKQVAVETPARPVSTAGLDGIARIVSRPTSRVDISVRLQLEDRAVERASRLVVAPQPVNGAMAAATPAPASAAADPIGMEVSAPAEPELGFIESLLGAVIGFLFG